MQNWKKKTGESIKYKECAVWWEDSKEEEEWKEQEECTIEKGESNKNNEEK